MMLLVLRPETVDEPRRRRIGLLAAGLFVVAAVVAVAWVGIVSTFGDSWCERSDSNYGSLSWSVLPPGHVCTWTADANGFSGVEGPGWQGSVYVVGLGLLGGAAAFLLWPGNEAATRLLLGRPPGRDAGHAHDT